MRPLDKECKQALLAPFQASEIRVRTQPSIQPYITARTVMSRLDDVIPFQWSFTLGEHWYDDKGTLHQRGTLALEGPQTGVLTYEDVGIAPPDGGKGPAKQSKQAVSDALKRCAIHVGVGRYLYELTGVQAQKLAKPGVERALAAVGYTGPWDERHYGVLGGIRHLDAEDEDALDAPTSAAAAESPAPAATTAPASAWASREDRARIIAAVASGGGAPESAAFKGWLAKHTANHTQGLEYVLAEDVESLLAQLQELAERRKA